MKDFTLRRFYIFGLQRSGTNYLQSLVEKNYFTRCANNQKHVWKHSISIPKRLSPTLPVFVIHKSPYTWVESLAFRNDVDWKKTQKTYLDWDNSNRIGPNKLNIKDLCETYNHFYNTWLSEFHSKNKIVVRYEDLLDIKTRNKCLVDSAKRFKFREKQKLIVDVTPGSVSQSKSYSHKMSDYYTEMKPQHLSDKTIDIMRTILDEELLIKMNYRLL